jgi:C-terminal processing protease CtpA/Prc
MAVNTCIAGHRGVRDGVIQTGAVALMLGAALAMNTARAEAVAAGTGNDEDTIARPAPVAPPAPSAPSASAAPAAAPAAPGAKAAAPAPAATPAPAARTPEGADTDARMSGAKQHMNDAQERWSRAVDERADIATRSAAERADIEQRLHDAQERMNRAAAEIAAIAAERASEAMERIPSFIDGAGPSRGPVIGVDLDPKSTGGALVRDVSPGGPAEEAGIRAGDLIVKVNGKDVRSDTPGGASRNVVRELQAFRGKPGRDAEKLKVQVLRDGVPPKDFEITPRRISNAFVFAPPLPPNPDQPGSHSFNYNFFNNGDLAGLEVTTLTPQLGRYFGVSKGVLVVRAPKRDTYKLQDGDVIVAIDGREPTSGSHITRILGSYQPGEQVTLRVMRDHKTQDIRVTVPDRRQSFAFPTWADVPM